MARWSLFVSIVFVIGASIFAIRSFQRPLIIVIQSYGDQIPWTRGTTAGLQRVLAEAKDIRVRWLYLDANHSTRTEYAQSKVDRAKSLIRSDHPQAIIAMDDKAQTEVAGPLLGHYPGWIIFGGINDATGELMHSTAPTVAGISQHTPWPAVQALLAEFARQKGISQPRVALINDTSPAGDEEAAGFKMHPWEGMQVAGLWRNKDHFEWQEALRAMRNKVDLVLVGDYRTMPLPMGMDRIQARKEIVRMTLAALPVPLASLSGYAVDDGIPVGILPSPQEQGEQAALLALAAVRSGVVSSRHQESREFIIHVNDLALASRALVLPELYVSFAHQVSSLFRPDRE